MFEKVLSIWCVFRLNMFENVMSMVFLFRLNMFENVMSIWYSFYLRRFSESRSSSGSILSVCPFVCSSVRLSVRNTWGT